MTLNSKGSQSSRLKAVTKYLVLALALAGCSDAMGPSDERVGAVQQSATGPRLTIQHLARPDLSGDVRVTVFNVPPAGASVPYLIVGVQGNPVILRDDGVGADLAAGDHVYSSYAFLNGNGLSKRSSDEAHLIKSYGLTRVPHFAGRAVAGDMAVEVFDIDRFNRENLVAFNPSNVFAPVSFPAPESTLLVNDPNVVADGDPTRTWNPCSSTGTKLGAFTFGHLMTEMANQPATGIDPSDFALQWLQKWQTTQIVNTFNVLARPNIAAKILTPWLAASGGVKLDLGLAPFRLLAIVNRLDLRTGSASYGGTTGNAGELRFVFGAVVPGTTCQLLPLTVIFEYGVPLSGCSSVRTWAQHWVDLQALALGSAPYNAALQALTDQVVLRGLAPGKPNGSALDQLRTNEIALANPWELRQFNLLASPSDFLHEVTVAQTPDTRFNAADPNWSGTTLLDSFITSQRPAIDAGTYVVPSFFTGTPFAGGAAPVTSNNLGYYWNANTLDLDLNHVGNWNAERHIFSLNTCNACHAGETKTQFTHVNPTTPLGSPAALSGFLTGITVADPAFGAPVRSFNDLARRQLDLESVAEAACLAFPPLDPNFVKLAKGGKPIPPELASQPVPPVSQQGTFFIEDFYKFPIQSH